jgi:poly(A) polymerase
VIDHSIDYGTLRVLANGYDLEITTMRQDVKTYGRKAQVEFGQSLQEDASRRDFTFNAIYLDLAGNIFDFHNGVYDLKAKTIRFIGDPDLRIKEDYLRILRFVRFIAAYEGMSYDPDDLEVIKANLEGISLLSSERVRDEFLKLLASPNLKHGLKVADSAGLLSAIFAPIALDLTVDFSADPIINLALVLELKSEADLLMLKKKLSLANLVYERLKLFISQPYSDDKAVHFAVFYKWGQQQYDDYLIYWAKKLRRQVVSYDFSEAKFPLRAQDLIPLGYQGKALGEKLAELENTWINSCGAMPKEQLLALAEMKYCNLPKN